MAALPCLARKSPDDATATRKQKKTKTKVKKISNQTPKKHEKGGKWAACGRGSQAEFIGKIRLLGVKLPTSILTSAAFFKI
jgi:hypothetical protein